MTLPEVRPEGAGAVLIVVLVIVFLWIWADRHQGPGSRW